MAAGETDNKAGPPELRELLRRVCAAWGVSLPESAPEPVTARHAGPRHPTTARILVAEDDREMRALLTLSLRRAGYEVLECRDGMELLNQLGAFSFPPRPDDIDAVISDIRMPGISGMEVLEALREVGHFPPVILITAFGDEETHLTAKRLGAVAVFDKPFDVEDLVEKIRALVPLKT